MPVHTQDAELVVDAESLLRETLQQIQEAGDLPMAEETAYPNILKLLDAERLTIYRRDRQSGEMVSRFKVADKLQEVRVSASSSSISGYCALSRQVINIADVYDAHVLTKIHPNLVFEGSFDRASGFRTRAMLVAPIFCNDAMLGVLQVINRRGGGAFSQDDADVVVKLAKVLGEKVRQEVQATTGPYDYLVQSGRVSQSDLNEIVARSTKERQTVPQLLMREMRVEADDIGESLERFYQVPYMPYDPAIVVPKVLTQGIKDSYLRTCGWLPMTGNIHEVTILIDNPSDSSKLRDVQRLINARKYQFKIGLPEDMVRYLGQELGTARDSYTNNDTTNSAGTETVIVYAPDENAAAVVQLVNRLLLDAHNEGASDIHIEPTAGTLPTTVRFRVDGICVLRDALPNHLHRAVVSRLRVLAKLSLAEQGKPQFGKVSLRHEDNRLEFQVAMIPTLHGDSAVLRALPSAVKPIEMEDLNLAPYNQSMLQNVLAQAYGMFLVVGPSGAGKTTSLHALLSELNTADRKICTAEEPVEIVQEGLQQVQVAPKAGLTFATALNSLLHCDPDVIMLGEMYDPETARLATEASLTGHLVLSTLRSLTAAEALVRLMDLGVDKLSVADALLGVMSQRLMRKLCVECRQPVQLTPEIQSELKALYGERFDDDCGAYLVKAESLFRHGKCAACHGTGFSGRTAIQELLVVSPELKRLILQGAQMVELIEAASRAGMRTLLQDQIVKAFQGLLDVDEVRGVR